MTSEATTAVKKTTVQTAEKRPRVYGRGKARLQKGLVYGAAILTFAVLIFLIAYILINGVPHLKPSLFEWTYNSDNVSMMPAIITTVEMTLQMCIRDRCFDIQRFTDNRAQHQTEHQQHGVLRGKRAILDGQQAACCAADANEKCA